MNIKILSFEKTKVNAERLELSTNGLKAVKMRFRESQSMSCQNGRVHWTTGFKTHWN